MAITNAEKRRSAAGIPFFLFLGVTPNSSKDQEWRQQAGWGYSGILATGDPTWSATSPASSSWSAVAAEDGAWTPTTPEDGTWTAT